MPKVSHVWRRRHKRQTERGWRWACEYLKCTVLPMEGEKVVVRTGRGDFTVRLSDVVDDLVEVKVARTRGWKAK